MGILSGLTKSTEHPSRFGLFAISFTSSFGSSRRVRFPLGRVPKPETRDFRGLRPRDLDVGPIM